MDVGRVLDYHGRQRQDPVECRIKVEGNRLIGVDVVCGVESVIKSDLGTYKSPEHALAMKLLWDRPDFLILLSLGRITSETIDKIADGLQKLKAKHAGGCDGVDPQ